MLLHKSGYNPIVIDNLSTGSEESVKWGPFVKGNIGDKRILAHVFQKYNPIAIIHFAAFSQVIESMLNPYQYFQNNVVETMNFIDTVIEMEFNNIIFSSSCAVYGSPKIIPISENIECKPINPYGETKLIIEKVLKWYGDLSHLKWISLRYFNVAGTSTAHNIGENIDKTTRLIPRAIKAALGYSPKLEVYGNEFDTEDGTAIRDYVNVLDIANAHILALDSMLNKNIVNQCFNIGNAIGFSVMEILNHISTLTGKSVPYEILKQKKGEPGVLLASNIKFNNTYNWKTNYSLEETISSTIDWVKYWYQKK